jgi:hypothetical protein
MKLQFLDGFPKWYRKIFRIFFKKIQCLTLLNNNTNNDNNKKNNNNNNDNNKYVYIFLLSVGYQFISIGSYSEKHSTYFEWKNEAFVIGKQKLLMEPIDDFILINGICLIITIYIKYLRPGPHNIKSYRVYTVPVRFGISDYYIP